MKRWRIALAGGLTLLSLLTPAVQAQTTSLVSVNSAGTNSGNALSTMANGPGGLPGCLETRQCMSADGRFVVFSSTATDLTTVPDTNGVADVFVRDTLLGTTTLVSVNAAGTAAGNGGSEDAVISADGTHVAFVSLASDLVATDTNGGFPNRDIFVRDLVAGTTALVSGNAAGTDSGNASSGGTAGINYVAISADGNRIAFASNASDLTALPNTAATTDIFVRDVTAGTTTLVSVNSAGTAGGNALSIHPVISPDGNKVVFVSFANNLVPNDFNGFGGPVATIADVFVRDLTAGTTTLVSFNAAGTDSGNERSNSPAISADGSHVVFVSRASNLVATDTNGGLQDCDVFVRNLTAGTTVLASVNSAGTDSGNGRSGSFCVTAAGDAASPSINSDGSKVAFYSEATNLVALPDTNSGTDTFVRDLNAGATTLASINSAGTAAGNAGGPTLSLSAFRSPALDDSGQFVAFRSNASDLTTPSGLFSVYVRDLTGGTTALITLNSAGTAATPGDDIAISPDGTTVAFHSASPDLVPFGVDANGTLDVFLRPLTSTPSLSIDDVSVTEGNSGTVSLNFTVSLSAASVATVTVDFQTAGNTATSGVDFVAGSGTVTFAPGQTTRPVIVAVNGDTLDEFDETLFVDLSNPTNATIADAQGVGTIVDDDPAPALSINDVSMAEGNSGTTNMVFTVSLSAVSGKDVSVTYLTADNTATQPSDYTMTSGTLNILAGNASGTLSVPIVGDTAAEANETFFVNLSAPVNATLADGQGQGTITDDEGPPFNLSSSASSINCTAGATAQFNITITPSTPPFNNPVALSCSGNPPQSTCTITPSSVTPGSSPATVGIRIHTTASAALRPVPWERESLPAYALVFPGLGLVGLVLATPPARKRRLRRLLEAVLLLAASLALLSTGCGGGGSQPGTPTGTYTVTITGTSGAASDSTSITLTIHQ